MQNPFKRLTDELFELGQTTKKAFVRDVVKGVPKTVVGQVAGTENNKSNEASNPSNSNKMDQGTSMADPITGKPVPSKRALSDLKNAVSQLQMQKLQKVREELAKQRNKIPDEQAVSKDGVGPQVVSENKKSDEAVRRAVQSSETTGEHKGSAGAG